MTLIAQDVIDTLQTWEELADAEAVCPYPHHQPDRDRGGQKRVTSELETAFESYIRFLAPDLAAGMVAQHPVGPGRKFRFDYAFPAARLGIELEGGLYSGGAHARPAGILRDMEKNNFAVLHNWRVLRYSTQHVTGDPEGMIAQIRTVLERET